MPKLYSSSYILKVLSDHGFIFISQKGSHIKLRKVDTITLTVIVPANRKEIPVGTFRSILRQSALTEADFK
ncbi:type II toxin-antitoxin system HicA family toxin [Mucilaginibacter sp. BJC16-A38]|uniref:type II toxin-antitoxin system HicA family toxin n=1 Tax=Mucilaginibacter phenanthrenivorans TaxID=1234842 RepID=UPI00358E48C4|nr:type II toxin-antitoxin system HicA family toxin [Mucilaginibacter phenanthrenivorans]